MKRRTTLLLLTILLLGTAPAPTVAPAIAQGVYRSIITIKERSGNDLYNYAIRIELNSTNFDGWGHVSENLSDVYFLDTNENPLYYWIEYASRTEKRAVIWVKVPYIPANTTVRIYMYYGGMNPFTSYNNASSVFMMYEDFNWNYSNSGTTGSQKIDIGHGWYIYVHEPGGRSDATWSINVDGDIATLSIRDEYPWDINEGIGIVYPLGVDPANVAVEFRAAYPDWNGVGEPTYYRSYRSGFINSTEIGDVGSSSAELVFCEKGLQLRSSNTAGESYTGDLDVLDATTVHNYVTYRVAIVDGKVEAFYDLGNGFVLWGSKTDYLPTDPLSIRFFVFAWYKSRTFYLHIDWVRVRPYVDPEPSIHIGLSTVAHSVELPPASLILYHSIVYSPTSSQFVHSFSANTTVAGYETNYTSPYGWRVYAEPYEADGTYYASAASLVSEVSIALPYAEALVENLTLLARTSGTGGYRRLWIRVLDSDGTIVAELTNTTIGTEWTEVVLSINTSLSRQVTIWINATVVSTTSVGEELAVRDVKLYVEYSEWKPMVALLIPDVDYFKCTATHYVELGSAEYLNASVITFKLVEYLILNATDYPVQPTYVSNETIDLHTYRVYRIEPASYSQSLTVVALLENRLKTFRTHVKGFDTDEVLVGDLLTIELPELGNITVVQLNKTFINVTSVTVSLPAPGVYTVIANVTQPQLWRIGYASKMIIARYGAFTVRPLDMEGGVIDYEDLVLQLINRSDGSVVRELTGNKLFSLDSLWAGNYTVLVKLKDVVVGARDFELNITTDGSVISVSCSMRSLATDYRGFNRTVVYELGKQLLGVESLSDRFPYSRMRVLLNGTGSFKLYINYRVDLPSRVSVTGNVSSLDYYWDGSYLVITGALGSVGEINVTDLYRLRVELYDRLGNLMPSWIYVYVNETRYSGAVVEDYYYPDDYVVKLPASINGFEFYGFFDGFNETARAVTINGSDVTLRAWYRIPTTVKEVRSFQVASLWWIPFIKQDSDRVKVYIEGYLRDYYGNGVPSRPVVINITDVEAGFTWSINTTTDATGYWRTPLLELVRGRVYRVEVVYAGDDIYVGNYSTMEVKPEELPVAPAAFEIPIEYLIAATATILVAAGVAAALRTAHVIEDLREKSRRFVKRKE